MNVQDLLIIAKKAVEEANFDYRNQQKICEELIRNLECNPHSGDARFDLLNYLQLCCIEGV